MYGTTCYSHAVFVGLLDTAHTRKARQEARVQVDHASFKGVNEGAFYYPHEACEHDQLW